MMDDDLMTLGELRQAGRKVSGEHDDELDELRRLVRDLRRDLDDARARLERRTENVRTLAGVLRQLAEHVGFELEVPRGSEVPSSVQQSEPG